MGSQAGLGGVLQLSGQSGNKSADSERNVNSFEPSGSNRTGHPHNSLADVIDSLKRLERVGSENSKTTEKLIAAAAELFDKVVKQYVLQDGEPCEVVRTARIIKPAALDDELPETLLFYYSIAHAKTDQ